MAEPWFHSLKKHGNQFLVPAFFFFFLKIFDKTFSKKMHQK